MIRSSVLATPPFIVSIKVAPHILHLFSEFFAIVMQNTFLPYKSYHYHFQNCHQPFFLASSCDRAKALESFAVQASISLSRHFQISHQRLVLRKLGLIANNIKRIPTTSKTNPRTLMLCVFIIIVNCPSCNHASKTPTIANITLTIKFIFILHMYLL
jgi:hypothetical protein